ncbi:MAG TPA: 4Fe-4S dicluster domain-containing protein [Gemmatimonadales bacterium]|jgi:molybdopterin-containing oxidoreductase family iron-sulfur binding subunit
MPPLNDAALTQIAAEMSRRDFARLLGASIALAGATGCVREPSDRVFPYIHTPAAGAGGELHYATAMTLDGYATGLLVRSVDGRPVKVEGNPSHPASRGASSALHQASLLQLYDPERAHQPLLRGRDITWDATVANFSLTRLRDGAGARGAGLLLLMDPTSSPLTVALLDRLQSALPDATVHFHHATENGSAVAASRAAFGAPLLPQPDFTQAVAVVALGDDPFAVGPWHLRQARDFGERRRAGHPVSLHVAETTPSSTSSLTPHRLAVAPALLANTALALLQTVASRLGSNTVQLAPVSLATDAAAWVDSAATALIAHRGHALVTAGPQQPESVHLVAMALNHLLDNLGTAIQYRASPIREAGAPSHDAATLRDALAGNGIRTVLITATNPAYTLPADVLLAQQLAKVQQSLYLGEYLDETARQTQHFAPRAHYLESWGVERAWDGTESPVQPLLTPMWGGHTVDELLASLLGDQRTGRGLLQALYPTATTDDALREGIVTGSTSPVLTPAFRWGALASLAPAPLPAAGQLTLIFPPGNGVHDGRFAGNAWLQELPDPITKLTWDNALLLAPATAARLAVASMDMVRVARDDQHIDVPVLITPGHADDAGSLALGYGRRGPGILENGIGVDTAPLRTEASPFQLAGVTLTRLNRQHPLALTQEHWSIEQRAGDILKGPPVPVPDSGLYRATPPGHDGFSADQWAMTIDLNLCTGCSACVVACQAENNIPVVGKRGVMNSREMHWIRLGRYLDADPATGGVVSQPMLCQHCENAPCEYVCPVNATVHSDDGLNEMVYNRCVGTRFCSNNCPYKVRRFNWLDYHGEMTPVDELINNPDVTVRARGVMEKCTFCVQRIRGAQERSQLAGDATTGPVVTACQQACPTGAIIFGSLTNPADAVVDSFADPRGFAALAKLNTRPRVHYLARDAAS